MCDKSYVSYKKVGLVSLALLASFLSLPQAHAMEDKDGEPRLTFKQKTAVQHYQAGLDAQQNDEVAKAHSHFFEGSCLGHALSTLALAEMYESANYGEFIINKYYTLAYTQGNEDGDTDGAAAYAFGIRDYVQDNLPSAYKWMSLAKERGHEEAQSYLDDFLQEMDAGKDSNNNG